MFCNVVIPILEFLFSRKKGKKCPFPFEKCRLWGQKVRIFVVFASKTSDFSTQNIRTFVGKHPYFVLKKSDVFILPAGKPRKKPYILILQYFRPGDVAVTSVALLGSIGTALHGPEMPCGMPVRKIAHSPCQSPCSGRARWSGAPFPASLPSTCAFVAARCPPYTVKHMFATRFHAFREVGINIMAQKQRMWEIL